MPNTPQYRSNLILKVLAPVCIALSILLVIGSITYKKQLDNNLDQYISNQTDAFSSAFYGEIHHKTKFLRSIHGLLAENKNLIEALESKDTDRLLSLSQPIFQGLKETIHVSHLYYTDVDRTNLLRVHAPSRHGDMIDRPTTIEADRLGKMIVGVGLGPLGTLTLRAVNPWVNERGERIGFVELGIDVEHIIEELSEENDFGIFLGIPKSRLDRALWEEGSQLFGGKADWRQFNDFVMGRESWLNEDHLSHLPNLDKASPDGQINMAETDQDKLYSWSGHPIKSLDGELVGITYLAVDVSGWYRNNQALLIKNALFYIGISIALLWVIYRYSRRAMIAEDELNKLVQKFEQLATYDQLTLLPNRALFNDELDHRLNESSRFNSGFAVLFIDIDDFKVINDTMGHEHGDTLLRCVAQRLRSVLREYDILARYGGDEFVLLMPQTKKEEVASIANKLLSSLEGAFSLGEQQIDVSLSIGISMYPLDGDNKEALMRYADTAMYAAKQAGKGCFRFYSSDTGAQSQENER